MVQLSTVYNWFLHDMADLVCIADLVSVVNLASDSVYGGFDFSSHK